MVPKSYIEKNLRQIDQLYVLSSSIPKGLFYSKLAMLELCGWIEISMDKIVLDASRRLLSNNNHQKYFERDIVKKVYGFEYELHFRRMIMALVGLRGVEGMEKHVNPLVFQPMCAALSALKPYRDKHAHEYIKGITLTLDAPSVTLGRLNTIHAGLVDIDVVLKKIK